MDIDMFVEFPSVEREGKSNAPMLQEFIIFVLVLPGILTERKQNLFNLTFFQHDYKIIPGPLVLVRFNKQYLKQYDVVSFKYNRTTTAVNFTFHFIKDIRFDMEVVTQVYRFASNEYRLFPLRFQYNFCAGLTKNAFGTADIEQCGNFTGCPFRKGTTFRLCNWKIDETKFPPYIPSGNYMVELQGMYQRIELILSRGYGEITRPIPWV